MPEVFGNSGDILTYGPTKITSATSSPEFEEHSGRSIYVGVIDGHTQSKGSTATSKNVNKKSHLATMKGTNNEASSQINSLKRTHANIYTDTKYFAGNKQIKELNLERISNNSMKPNMTGKHYKEEEFQGNDNYQGSNDYTEVPKVNLLCVSNKNRIFTNGSRNVENRQPQFDAKVYKGFERTCIKRQKKKKYMLEPLKTDNQTVSTRKMGASGVVLKDKASFRSKVNFDSLDIPRESVTPRKGLQQNSCETNDLAQHLQGLSKRIREKNGYVQIPVEFIEALPSFRLRKEQEAKRAAALAREEGNINHKPHTLKPLSHEPTNSLELEKLDLGSAYQKLRRYSHEEVKNNVPQNELHRPSIEVSAVLNPAEINTNFQKKRRVEFRVLTPISIDTHQNDFSLARGPSLLNRKNSECSQFSDRSSTQKDPNRSTPIKSILKRSRGTPKVQIDKLCHLNDEDDDASSVSSSESFRLPIISRSGSVSSNAGSVISINARSSQNNSRQHNLYSSKEFNAALNGVESDDDL